MPVPDPKYLPKSKRRSKALKAKRAARVEAFPAAPRRAEVKPLKKKAPFGDKYVWVN